ncbi:energy transducer TonB [Lysobacter cavernae]|uniref:Energy transducer TonB n=1 Tax=Lysobacter cavernae TaxID=1685901 RepID=A0ABV7RT32_9GAMM
MNTLRQCLPACCAVALGTLLAACHQGPAVPSIPSTKLMAIDTPPPAYPPELACDEIGGQVVLLMSIGPDGRPKDVRTAQSSRVQALDQAAHEAVRHWRFQPATRGGQPVTTTLQVPVNFKPPVMRPDSCFVLDEQRKREG